MKKCTLILILILLFAGEGWAATYYVSAAGSNTSPYDTWAKAANLPSTAVTAGNSDTGGDGPHIMYIAPGTYDSYLTLTDSDWDYGTIQGTSAHGSTALAAPGQVIISNATSHTLQCSKTGVTVKSLSLTGTDATHDLIYLSGENFVGEDIYAYNSGRLLLYTTNAANFIFRRLRLAGAGGSLGVSFAGTSSGVISFFRIENSATMLLSTNIGVQNSGSGDISLTNGIIQGATSSAVANTGAGSTTIKNSIIASGDSSATSCCVSRTAGAATVENCLLIPNWRKYGQDSGYFAGTVTDTNNLKTVTPRWQRHQRRGFVVPCVDDTANHTYATELQTVLAGRGLTGTWYINTGNLSTYLAQAQAIRDAGVLELGFHAMTNARLDTTGGVYAITKAGATINVDRASDTITVSGAGTVSGFKAKRLDTIKTALEAIGCTVGDIPATLDSGVMGECFADSAGNQASPYTPQLLIDPTGAAGFFKAEIFDPLAYFSAQLGVVPTTIAPPGGQSSDDVQAAAVNAGFSAVRSALNMTDASWGLSSINLTRLVYLPGESVVGASDAATRANVRSIAERLSQVGGILVIVNHSTQVSQANWEIILDTIQSEYPEITITSLAAAVDEIKNSGIWTTADNITYTRTWTDLSDYRLQGSSPLINAGLNSVWAGTANVFDYAGTRITDAAGNICTQSGYVSIGAYQATQFQLMMGN